VLKLQTIDSYQARLGSRYFWESSRNRREYLEYLKAKLEGRAQSLLDVSLPLIHQTGGIIPVQHVS